MHFGDKVFRTVIPRNVRLAEAPSFGKAVLFHDKDSRGALAYLALAGEMIRREEEALAGPAPEPDKKSDPHLSLLLRNREKQVSVPYSCNGTCSVSSTASVPLFGCSKPPFEMCRPASPSRSPLSKRRANWMPLWNSR